MRWHGLAATERRLTRRCTQRLRLAGASRVRHIARRGPTPAEPRVVGLYNLFVRFDERPLDLALPGGLGVGYGTALCSLEPGQIIFSYIPGGTTAKLVRLDVAGAKAVVVKGLRGSLRDAIAVECGLSVVLTDYALHRFRNERLEIGPVKIPKYMGHLYAAGRHHIVASRWFSKTTVVYAADTFAEERRMAQPTDLVLPGGSGHILCSFQSGRWLECDSAFEV